MNWIQKGQNFTGITSDSSFDYFGYFSGSTSFSDNGSIVGIGAPQQHNVDGTFGYVKVYEWDGSNWTQKGDDIVGTDVTYFGYNVSLSSDGNRISILSNNLLGDKKKVYVFEYNTETNGWTILGSSIEINDAWTPDYNNDINHLDISSDGDTIAFRSNNGSEICVEVYTWDSGKSLWSQKISESAIVPDSGITSIENIRISINGNEVGFNYSKNSDFYAVVYNSIIVNSNLQWSQHGNKLNATNKGFDMTNDSNHIVICKNVGAVNSFVVYKYNTSSKQYETVGNSLDIGIDTNHLTITSNLSIISGSMFSTTIKIFVNSVYNWSLEKTFNGTSIGIRNVSKNGNLLLKFLDVDVNENREDGKLGIFERDINSQISNDFVKESEFSVLDSVSYGTPYGNFGTSHALNHDGSVIVIGDETTSTFRGSVRVYEKTNYVAIVRIVFKSVSSNIPSAIFNLSVDELGNILSCYDEFTNSSVLIEGATNTYQGFFKFNSSTVANMFLVTEPFEVILNYPDLKFTFNPNTENEYLSETSGAFNGSNSNINISVESFYWKQKGQTVVGLLTKSYDNFGHSVSVTNDGNTFITGAHGNDNVANYGGALFVYDYNSVSNVWVQRGSTIYGENMPGFFGYSVSISGDGQTIVGGAYFTSVYSTRGYIKVFTWNSLESEWIPYGDTLFGDQYSRTGWCVSLSKDGTTVSACAPTSQNTSNGSTGRVTVYSLDNNNLVQKGSIIINPISSSYSNFADFAKLNGDGTKIAVSSSYVYKTFVFSYNADSDSWNKYGLGEITADTSQDFGFRSDTSLDIDETGDIVVVGYKNGLDPVSNKRSGKVYKYIFENNGFKKSATSYNEPLDNSIIDTTFRYQMINYFGKFVSISGDGKSIAISNKYENISEVDTPIRSSVVLYKDSSSDVPPPTITIIGSDPIYVAVNTPFVDPGFTTNEDTVNNTTTNFPTNPSEYDNETGFINEGFYNITYTATNNTTGLVTEYTRSVIVEKYLEETTLYEDNDTENLRKYTKRRMLYFSDYLSSDKIVLSPDDYPLLGYEVNFGYNNYQYTKDTSTQDPPYVTVNSSKPVAFAVLTEAGQYADIDPTGSDGLQFIRIIRKENDKYDAFIMTNQTTTQTTLGIDLLEGDTIYAQGFAFIIGCVVVHADYDSSNPPTIAPTITLNGDAEMFIPRKDGEFIDPYVTVNQPCTISISYKKANGTNSNSININSNSGNFAEQTVIYTATNIFTQLSSSIERKVYIVDRNTSQNKDKLLISNQKGKRNFTKENIKDLLGHNNKVRINKEEIYGYTYRNHIIDVFAITSNESSSTPINEIVSRGDLTNTGIFALMENAGDTITIETRGKDVVITNVDGVHYNIKDGNGNWIEGDKVEGDYLEIDGLNLTIGSVVADLKPIICFREGTKILSLNEYSEEAYRNIETLKNGDFVKTYKNGYIPIYKVGSRLFNNRGDTDNSSRSKDHLYRYLKHNHSELIDDLVLTGCHSVLVDKLTDEQKKKTIEVNGDTFITDGKYRLMSMHDERAQLYPVKEECNIWHIALDHQDYYMNYGIFANGMLVESTSKRMMDKIFEE